MTKRDEVRVRLATAESDARRALVEATQIGRLLINGPGPVPGASLQAMADRLDVLRHAVHDLQAVHDALRRLEPRSSLASPDEAIELRPPPAADGPCASCHRADALVPVVICARCSGLGIYGTDEERGWASWRQGAQAR